MTQQQTPICDEEAEDAVISSAILSPDAWEVARDIVVAEDFWVWRNRYIWLALAELDAKGSKFDIVTIAGHLRDSGKLDSIGGTPALARLLDATPAVAHVTDHAGRVAALARQRRIVDASRRIAAEGQTIVGSIDDFCSWAESELGSAAEKGQSNDAPSDLGTTAAEVVTSVEERMKSGSGMAGYPSGLLELDRRISGWNPVLYVIAGRPGMGKTAFAQRVAMGIAEATGKLAFQLSLEMPKEDLASRALSGEARVSLQAIRTGDIKGHEDALIAAATKLSRLPFSILFRPAATVADVRAAARRALRDQRIKHGADLEIGCIVVDYMQIMRGDTRGNREQEVSGISRGLMAIAGELKCPVLALSQLNRSVETRDVKNKRPNLSDLRESGAIEQDADTIMFLYRDEYYHEDSPDQGVAECIVAKQRNGPTGTVKLRFSGKYTLFENLASDNYDFSEMDYPG